MVSRILRQNGLPVYDCDAEAKRIMNSSGIILNEIINRFGEEVVDNGIINRKVLSNLIFNNALHRVWLNDLVHQAVRDDFFMFADSFKLNNKIFIETAIPYTARFEEFCNEFYLVEAPDDIRIQRIGVRNTMSKSEILARMNTQQLEYDSLPTDICRTIINDGIIPLLPQLNVLLN
ncbi:MAG: dephospho-CoA kinase [Prevotella sp.]|nr:dephospho-CoA kinase [Bacteroides sp.]MCM1365676.1 dephospho-CoA kinase [Prevotella sp.]